MGMMGEQKGSRAAGTLLLPTNVANGICDQYRVHAIHTLHDKDRSKLTSVPLKKKKALFWGRFEKLTHILWKPGRANCVWKVCLVPKACSY